MRVVVVGATGNVGTSLIEVLQREPSVTDLVGVARRLPQWHPEGVTWVPADIATADLHQVVAGADAVVHLAWLLQPSRDEAEQWRTNVTGTRRLLQAVADEQVPVLVYASSIGAYSPAPAGQFVDESWPTDGVPTSAYSRQKAYTERLLDAFTTDNPAVRVVRLRPGLVLKPEAASEIRRLFAGPLLPSPLLRAVGLPVWPATKGLELQFVDSFDLAEAYRLAVVSDVEGAFNVAADPVLDARTAADALHAFAVPLPARVLRGAVSVTWRLRLHPTDPGWIDLAVSAPLMSTQRAREVLGWTPRRSADDVLAEFVEAVGRSEGMDTPPLDPDTGGPARLGEIATGIGQDSV